MDHMLQMRSGTFAVRADTGFHAGGGPIQADGVDGRSQVFDPGHGRIQVRDHFIHADHQDHFFGSETHGRHPVAQAVQVDDFAIQRQGIGTGDHDVRQEALPSQFRGRLRGQIGVVRINYLNPGICGQLCP